MVEQNYIYTIDVAHPSRKPEQVEEILQNVLLMIRNHSYLRVIKVIHGSGKGLGSNTRETVRNWLYVNRAQFEAVVNGEDYSVLRPEIQELRSQCGKINDRDLDNQNWGITIAWVK